LLAARVRGLEAGVANNREPAVRAPGAIAGLARGRAQMSAIRQEISSGLAAERALLAERTVSGASPRICSW
jgi:hypothetical protein